MKGKLLTVLLCLTLLLAFTACGNGANPDDESLNEDEQYALDCINDMKSQLLDDGCFTLTGDIYLLKQDFSDGQTIYTVFDYSGTSGYRGPISGKAVYKDGRYCMDLNDEIETDGSTENLDKAIVYRNISLAETDMLDENEEKVVLDTEKIAKALENQ